MEVTPIEARTREYIDWRWPLGTFYFGPACWGVWWGWGGGVHSHLFSIYLPTAQQDLRDILPVLEFKNKLWGQVPSIGLSYLLARLHRLSESIPGLLKNVKISSQYPHPISLLSRAARSNKHIKAYHAKFCTYCMYVLYAGIEYL